MLKKLQHFPVDLIEKTGFFFLGAATKGVLGKNVFFKFHKIHRITPVPDSLF